MDGTQLGIKSLQEAISLANARGQDLIEISGSVTPVVAKIGDYSKYRYEKEKRLKESRKHQKGGVVKEIRMNPRIGEHDLNVKINHIQEFIEERNKVKITIVFRGREMEHRDLGFALLNKIKSVLEGKIVVEQEPLQDRNRLSLMIAPFRK